MRVITGTARGRRLQELEGLETRPTTSRVKEGMFSALQFEIEGRRVLDLFAGTGQLGIECLSRGAASAVFVDQRKDAVQAIRTNLKETRLVDGATVVQGDSIEYLKSCGQGSFDLVFLDPPYASGLRQEALRILCEKDILAPDGIIVAESPTDQKVPPLSEPYRIWRSYRYGRIALTVYRRAGAKKEEMEE